MYEYLKGQLIEASFEKVTLDVNGIGYQIFISIATFEQLPDLGKSLQLFLSFVVREDAQKLYGFLSPRERNFFETLCNISGIGPRLAISILGHMGADDLLLAAQNHNAKAISSVPGIGKKMAERLVLELQGKAEEKTSLSPKATAGPIADAISALINLGYKPLEAQKAVNAIAQEGETPPLADLISMVLKSKTR